MQVVIENLTKKFGDAFALKNINLTVQEHELFFLLGPSGCGKTTLLRTIAGFYKPDEGRVLFGGRIMNDVPPHKRNTGMVFQNYALWPHMTIAENVAYGLEVRGLSKDEIKQRVREALAIVQMEQFADRMPNQLSGGQQQRVALARALVIKPDVLLLDEPLSNLDARLRLEMRAEIRRIHEQTQITTIYVTHDQKEALSLADRIALLRNGEIEQIGDPRTIYRAPLSKFVADFIGEINWIKGEVTEVTNSQYIVKTDHGVFRAEPPNPISSSTRVWVGFRPEAVEFKDESYNTLTAVVEDVTYLGEIEQYTLRISENTTIKAFEQNPLEIRKRGEKLKIHIRPFNILLYEQN